MTPKEQKKKKTINLELADGTAGKSLRLVHEPIGGGKQGAVYIKRGRGKSPDQAVKIFYHCSPEAEESIKKLITAKFPKDVPICKPKKYFHTKDGRFGYVMDLIGEEFVQYKDLLTYLAEGNGNADKLPNLAIICRICYGLAEIVQCIHDMGWVFPDLSENNFAFQPKTGLVILFDADNLRTEAEAQKGNVAIRGTFGSMAPELVLGECYPNPHSDNFALASVIFQMFMHHYPYDGRAMLEEINDTDYYRQFHGEDPVFAFSAKRKNRVLPRTGYYVEMWERWDEVIPDILKSMFRRAFESGAKNPEKRPDPRDWMYIFHILARKVIYCPKCKHEMFAENELCECPKCATISWVPDMWVGNRVLGCTIPIYKNQEISPFEMEFSPGCQEEFTFHKAVLPIAKLVEDKGSPYLVNLDPRGEVWTCSYGEIMQEMAYGEGNLFAENVCIRIPVKNGTWTISVHSDAAEGEELPFA